MNRIILMAALTSAVMIPSLSYSESVSPKVGQKLGDEIAKLEVKFNLKAPDLNIGNILRAGGGYQYKVEPGNYTPDVYLRSDRVVLNTSLIPGFEIADGVRLGFGLKKGTAIEFIRQFQSQSEALKALPYTYKNIPFNAEQALKRLKPSDYVEFDSDLSVHVSAGLAKSKWNIVFADASVGYVIQGQFRIQVYRKEDNRLWVRAFAINRKALGAGAHIRFAPDVKFTGIKLFDRAGKRLLKEQLVAIDASKFGGELAMLEYDFNLNDANGRSGYDLFVGATKSHLKDLESYKNVMKGGAEFEEQLVVAFDEVEKLAKAGSGVKAGAEAISKYHGDEINNQLSIKFANWGRRNNFTGQTVSFREEDGQVKKFLFGTYLEEAKKGIRLGGAKLSQQRSRMADAVFELDENENIVRPLHIGFFFNRGEETLLKSELDRIEGTIRSMLPASLQSELDFANWSKRQFRRKTRIQASLFISGRALEVLGNRLNHFGEFAHSVETAAWDVDRYKDLYADFLADEDSRARYNERQKFEADFADDLSQIARDLFVAFTGTDESSTNERWDKFVSLRNVSLFRQAAPGMLMRLLEQPEPGVPALTAEEMKQLISFQVKMNGKGEDDLDLSLGSEQTQILGAEYDKLRVLRETLQERTFNEKRAQD